MGTDFALASPKSASFKSPPSLMSRFCGFKSLQTERGGMCHREEVEGGREAGTHLCNILLEWQYDNPRNSWNRKSYKWELEILILKYDPGHADTHSAPPTTMQFATIAALPTT